MDWTLTIVVLILTFFFADGHPEGQTVYRYWHRRNSDHFYTTNWNWRHWYHGYYNEGARFRVLAERKGTSTALYSYWSEEKKDHFYTTNKAEIGVNNVGEVGNNGYKLTGILGFCFPPLGRASGTVPLYRYNNGAISDHFYTTNFREGQREVARNGYNFEGIQCYVYPA